MACIASRIASDVGRAHAAADRDVAIVDAGRSRRRLDVARKGWPSSSLSGRLLTIIVTPSSFSASDVLGRDLARDQSLVVQLPDHAVVSSVARDHGKHRLTIALELGFADARISAQLGQARRPRCRHLAQASNSWKMT